MPVGISVVIPCHNAARRLPQTLAHLAAQQVPDGLEWEVVLVDNASTDETSQSALACWPAPAPVPLRVVREPRLGLSYAHLRGFAEAQCEVITFVEDDNWVCPEWLQLVAEVMGQHPEVGACGGYNEAVCEVEPPGWFVPYQAHYATGPQAAATGDVTWTRGYLWGAGLTVRRAAWRSLIDREFRPLLVDRQGKRLNTGGDAEICFALRLAGWRLWYEPRLRLRHFLLAHRLKWPYLRRLNRGVGASQVGLDPYRLAVQGPPESSAGRLKRAWQAEARETLKKILRRRNLLLMFLSPMEGDGEALYLERQIGRLIELLRRREAYDRGIQAVWGASWRRLPRS